MVVALGIVIVIMDIVIITQAMYLREMKNREMEKLAAVRRELAERIKINNIYADALEKQKKITEQERAETLDALRMVLREMQTKRAAAAARDNRRKANNWRRMHGLPLKRKVHKRRTHII